MLKILIFVYTGGIAGGMELFISYPTEYVKTQLQLYGRQVSINSRKV